MSANREQVIDSPRACPASCLLVTAGCGDLFDASVVELRDIEVFDVVDGAGCGVDVEPQRPGRGIDLDVVDILPGYFAVDEFEL